jgi:uncharacterized protein
MSLKITLKDQQIKAQKTRDSESLRILRMALAEIKQIEVDTRKDLTDDDVTTIIKKMVKQRKESLKAFQDGNREDLAVIEEKEIEFLSKYLPKPLSEDELNRAIHEAIQKLDATTPADMGKVMAELKVRFGGRGDMSQASKTVREILSKSS